MADFGYLDIGKSVALLLLLGLPGLAQIRQDQPQLCGKPNEAVPLPEGMTFKSTLEAGGDGLTIELKDGSIKTIDLKLPGTVSQVCPLRGDRLLVFGEVAGNDGPHVWIVSRIDGGILDHIGSRDPVVSPDQHWIAYRQFYPQRSVVVSERYLLYDLTKGREGNRILSDDPTYEGLAGEEVYPVTKDHRPLGPYDSLEPLHSSISTFFWSSDSKFVAFGDTGESGFSSIVVAKLGATDLTTYTRPINGEEICGKGWGRTVDYHMLQRLEMVPEQGVPDIWIYPDIGNCNQPVLIRGREFKAGQIEVHSPLKRPSQGPTVK
ncbi:MAG: hypothetical protein C5B51_01810 [Terriglobia bacterium]|nr:MAG: hypothetical protein C5B51_01810 [Terriglobia bacterium]